MKHVADWTGEDCEILNNRLLYKRELIGALRRDEPCPEAKDFAIMAELEYNRLWSAVERTLDLNETRLVSVWVADYDNTNPGPYQAYWVKGDLIVDLQGYDPGSVPWEQNWGDWHRV